MTRTSPAKLKLDWCSRKAAKFAVEQWHYSKQLSAARSMFIGVWEDGAYIGCVVFAHGANPHLGSKWGYNKFQTIELSRIALRGHKTHVTRIIKIALKMLRNRCPKVRLVVSFADPNEGHSGGIYQGANWIYTGMSAGSPQYRWKGKWVHPRTLTGPQFGRAPSAGRGEYKKMPKRKILGKHRYLWAFDKIVRKKIQEKGSVEYPSRCVGPLEGPPLPVGERRCEPDPNAPKVAG